MLSIVSSATPSFLQAQTTATRQVSISFQTVVLVNIQPGDPITLAFTRPDDAGSPLNSPVNTSKWINYSSAVGNNSPSRTITASINKVIPNIKLSITAAAATGFGGGTLGTSTGTVTLTTTPSIIISGIRGAYTGAGISNGHNISLTATWINYTLLSAFNDTVSIVYTISDF